MRLLSFLVWKNWASSPLRFLLTWCGVGLGVAVVAAIHVLDHNTILSQIETRRWDYGRVDFELRPLRTDVALDVQRQRLAARDDIDRVGLLATTPVQARADGKSAFLATLYGLAPIGGDLFGHYRVGRGDELDELSGDNEVLVAPHFARVLGLDVGTRFELEALPRDLRTVCIGGKRVAAESVEGEQEVVRQTVVVRGILEPFRIARRDAGLVVVGKFGLVARFSNVVAPLFQVKRTEGADPDRIETELRGDYFFIDSRSAMIGEQADERAFRNGVKVLGCLALILGMFVIFHTLSHSLAEKIRRVGILRSIGATQGQVVRVFLVDALLLSVLGTTTGLGLGVGLARVLANAQITTLGLGKPVTTFELPWTPLLAVAGLGIAFTMLGAAFPLLKIRRLAPQRILYARDLAPPADLMRGVNLFLFVLLVVALPVAYLAMTPLLTNASRGAGYVLLEAVSIVAVFFGVLLLSPRLVRRAGGFPLVFVRRAMPLATFLVRKNLLRSPGRAATAVCGLTLVALAMLGMRALTGSLKAEIRDFGAVALERRVFAKTENPAGAGVWRKLRQIPGVEAVLPLSAVVAMPFRCIGTDPAELAKPGGCLAGRPELVARMDQARGIVISRRLQKLRDLDVGSKVPVTTGEGVVHYVVVAVSDADGFFPDERAWALAARKWFEHDFCLVTKNAQRFSLRISRDSDPDAVAGATAAVLGRLDWLRHGDEVLASHLGDVDRDFMFFDILLWLLLALAGLGQVNLMTLTAISRAREIGVLRALGMTRADFVRTLIVESAVVGFLAGVLALAAGLPLSFVVVHGLQAVSGLDVPFVMPWLPALGIAGLSFGVALAAAFPPALRATATPPARAVRATE